MSEFEELQTKYNELKIQFKKQKRYNRKINRNKYNQAREEAAKSDIISEFRKKINKHISKLNSDIFQKNNEIENLQEECAFWKQERFYNYQKYIAALCVALGSSIGMFFTLKGVENCICE